MKKQMKTVFPQAVICLALTSTDALAYLDPATGSIILQGILAGLAGAALTIRIYWARIKEFFGKSRTKSSE